MCISITQEMSRHKTFRQISHLVVLTHCYISADLMAQKSTTQNTALDAVEVFFLL